MSRQSERERGQVVRVIPRDDWWYGFVRGAGDKDLFTCADDVPDGHEPLHVGQWIEFTRRPAAKGPRAVNVLVINA